MSFDVHVDGFPRSANTYTAFYLNFSQGNHLKVRSRHHVPPSIISSVQRGKPVLFLLRPPRESVISWAIFMGHDVTQHIRYYRDFHMALRPFREHLFIALFADAVAELPALLRQFDRRFNLGLDHNYHCAAVQLRVAESIHKCSSEPDGRPNERVYHLPLQEREALKGKLRLEMDRLDGHRLLRQAEELFQYFALAATRPLPGAEVDWQQSLSERR
jgi:hypothetical protein